MKTILSAALCVTLLAAVRCPAQTTAPSADSDLPAGPWVLDNAPEFARWNIDYRYADAATRAKTRETTAQRIAAMSKADPAYARMLAANPAMLLALDPPRLAQVAVTKTRNLQQKKLTYEGNMTGEAWNDGTVEMARLPGAANITVDLASGDPARDDFQEFAWITKGNFQSRKKIDGRDCLIFRDNMPALKLTNPRLYGNLKSADPGNAQVTTNVPVTATVEAVTKLPISLQIGDELHVFSFLPAGTEMLVLPDAFALAAKQTVAEYRAKHKAHPLP